MDIKDVLLQWFINSLIQKLRVEQLKKKIAEELHQPIIQKNFKKKSTLAFYSQYLSCWSIVNKGIPFQLCVIDIYSKYAWVILMKDEKCITIADAFQKILKESNCI